MGVHAAAIVEPGAEVAPDAEIGPWCRVAAGARIGPRARLHAHVVIEAGTELAEDVVVHPFAVLGGAPQHRADAGEGGRLFVGARTVVREHVTFNRGTDAGRGATEIGADGYFMTAAHVGHDCVVGANVTFANAATLGGHVEIGEGVFIGGLAAVHQRCRIGAFAMIGGLSAVAQDVVPYALVSGDRARLAGVNLVGLKRRGVPRAEIHALRAAYRFLFEEDDAGAFSERLDAARARYADEPAVAVMLDFIDADRARPLCPARR